MPDVLTDNFDDNTPGSNWYQIASDPSHVWLAEESQRLELMSASGAAGTEAAYHSKGWRLDTSRDFAVRVDWLIAKDTGPAFGLSLKVSKDVNNYVGYTVNHADVGGNKMEAEGKTAGSAVTHQSVARTATSGTLYISYDSILDRLYVSPIGYYRREDPNLHDWAIADLVRGAWGSTSVGITLSGSVQGVELISGEATFDNFVLDDGTLLTPDTHTLDGNIRADYGDIRNGGRRTTTTATRTA